MQRSGAVSQRFPSVPDGQAQKKLPSKLMQLALFRHGCDWQKLMSFSHLCPESWPALAVILVDLVQASVRPYGIARIVQAYVNLALNAQKSWPAPALETFQGVAAGLAVVARLAPAVVDAVLALFAREAQGAEAAVVSLNVLALAAIEARIAGTFVHLDSAVGARPDGLAEAQTAEEEVRVRSCTWTGRCRSSRCSWTVPPGTEGRNSRTDRSRSSLAPGRDMFRHCNRAGRRSRRC